MNRAPEGPVVPNEALVLPPDRSAAINASITISPFSWSRADDPHPPVNMDRVRAALSDRTGGSFVATQSGRSALALILGKLGLASDDVITIVTTSGSDYVSRCVSEVLERYCRWSMKMEPATKAFIVIHEWGRACEGIDHLLATRLPVIEDCAYAFGSRYASGELVGRRGSYALFSFPKMFSVNWGGMAVGVDLPGSTLSDVQESYLLSCIAPELFELEEVIDQRRKVLRQLEELFGQVGATPFYSAEEGSVPPVYLFKHDPATIPFEVVRAAFDSLGVEASAFYGNPAFYVPAHQRLGPASQRFMLEIYRSVLAASPRAAS
jgi:dTDP-4-amino-4,6-dideoxygalactose transaminase